MEKINLIAETAWHHDGDFNFLKKLVRSIVNNSNADIVKVHITLDFDEYMALDHPLYTKGKEWLLDKDQWKEIIEIIVRGKKQLMMLFNDRNAIDFGMQFEPQLVEIHSVCLNDVKLLDFLKQSVSQITKIVLGVGGTTLEELDHAIHRLNHKNIVLMHGFQNFPTKYSHINFKKIRKIIGLYPYFKHGYADHTAWDEPNNLLITLMGAAQGMDYVEKHVTIAYGVERTDWSAAISIDMFNKLYEKIQLLEKCLGNGQLSLNEAEKAYSVFGPMKKAAIINRNIKKGEIFSMGMIDFKRTGQKTDLTQLDVIESVGKRLSMKVEKGQVLKKAHLGTDKE